MRLLLQFSKYLTIAKAEKNIDTRVKTFEHSYVDCFQSSDRRNDPSLNTICRVYITI